MTDKLKMTRGSGNVFHDVGFPAEEAQNLLLRSDLMTRIHCDFEIQGGAPVFFGTRVPVKNLFDYLEAGDSLDQFQLPHGEMLPLLSCNLRAGL